jgi:uncharacterized membrane protein (UPF0182 family)
VVAARRPPRRWTLAVLLLAFILLAAIGSLSRFYTDLLWFREVDKTAVFFGALRAKVVLGLLAGLLTALIVGVNLWMVERLAPRYGLTVVARPQVERARAVLAPYLRPLRIGIAAFLGLVIGLGQSGLWQTFLLWRNRVPFGDRDPLFGKDVGFYVFELPFLRAAFSWLFTTMVLTTLLVAAAHYVLGGIRPQAETNRIAAQAQAHLSVLLGLIIALKAWGYWLDKFQLLFSPRGVVAGASYTDVKAQLPALQLLFWVALICAGLFFWGARTRGVAWPLVSIVLLAGVSLIVGGLVPAVFQRFRVAPQELQRERTYIGRNITATRNAFGLKDVDIKPFTANGTLNTKAIDANRDSVDNIRLWDPEVLKPAVQNLQAVAQYYSFSDVDVDRYPVADKQRQVMISVREVDPNLLAPSARTWQNLHLAYTHGYGVVATQVNTAATSGQPDFIVANFDQTKAPIPVTSPRVYFGEPPGAAPDYVVVDSKQPEVDAPTVSGQGTTNTFSYDGVGGIRLSDVGRRLAFALRFRDVNLLISGNITPRSRLMFNRDVRDRVEQVAPFLQWDGDPYAVVVNGQIMFVRDGYTTTNNYPYSQRIDLADAARRTADVGPGVQGQGNYIRNSVKAVVNAYTGQVTLYAFDETDPILRAWRKAFPSLFTPIRDMPQALREHLRYPEDMFSIQTWMYASYHIGDPDDFYSKEDFWALPDDRSGEIQRQEGGTGLAVAAPVKARPYYLLTKPPGSDDLEFVLAMPFTPNGKENMVSYMVAASDPTDYGKITLFSLDRARTQFGPTQVNARILANTTIASELTLLNQQGSKVILGNLLVVPVEDSILYVQPIFVQGSAANSIPLLQKVAVFYNTDVGYATTLSGAINQVIGGQPPPTGGQPTQPAQPPAGNASVQQLLQQADREFQLAQDALVKSNLASYQQHINRAHELVSQALKQSSGAAAAQG